jgi:hypothetical protein
VARYRSIQLFSILFTLSLLMSTALAFIVTSQINFAVRLTPEAAATLERQIQGIRTIGLGFALILLLLVAFAASRAARSALAARWVLGIATSVAFLRGIGLVQPLSEHDNAIIAISAFQILLEAFAIVLLYGEDANEWFVFRR